MAESGKGEGSQGGNDSTVYPFGNPSNPSLRNWTASRTVKVQIAVLICRPLLESWSHPWIGPLDARNGKRRRERGIFLFLEFYRYELNRAIVTRRDPFLHSFLGRFLPLTFLLYPSGIIQR